MGLHGDVGVQMVESTVGLLTSLIATFVHALDFFIATTGTLVLLSTGDGHEGIDL